MRSILLTLLFAALAVLSLPAHAQVSDSEAQAVAAGVLAHADWRQQKEGCAAGVMPAVGQQAQLLSRQARQLPAALHGRQWLIVLLARHGH
jgi:hypothetical protein